MEMCVSYGFPFT